MPSRKRAATACAAQTTFADLLTETIVEPVTSVATGCMTVAETLPETPAVAPVRPATPFSDLVPVYTVKLVRTGSLWLQPKRKITAPFDAVELLEKHLAGADREYFVAVLLDAKMQLIGVSTISTGDLSSALVHPREVFKPAILANAAAVLLAHNHPSGDPTPSADDLAVTRRLAEGGALLGIDVLDHLVLGEPGRFVSIRERGLCDFLTGSPTNTREVGRSTGLAP